MADLATLRSLRERVIEECAQICEAQARAFLDERYAGQPMSSFAERFACGQCAKAVRALITRAEQEDAP